MKKYFYLLLILLAIVSNAQAYVVKSENFESWSYPWNNATDPQNGWDAGSGAAYAVPVTVDGATHYAFELGAAGTGRDGVGKALIAWKDGTAHMGNQMYRSLYISKAVTPATQVMYIRWYMKTTPNMDFTHLDAQKFFRFNISGGNEIYFDIKPGTNGISWCGNSAAPVFVDDMTGGFNWRDGNWHAHQLMFNIATKAISYWIDGNQTYNGTNLTTNIPTTSYFGDGPDAYGQYQFLQHFPLGNSETTDTFPSGAWLSISYDDVVIATTKAETDPTSVAAGSGSSGDTIAPVLSNGTPTGALASGTKQTAITVTTNENATCKYSSTAGTAYTSMTNNFSTTGGTSHSTTISGLSDGGSYTQYIRCIDGSGNADTTDYSVSWSVASAGGGGSTPPAGGGSSTPIMSESFESAINNNRGWIDGSMTDIVSGGQSGNALRWTWAAGATQPTGSNTVRYDLGADYQQLFVRYYVKFDSAWRGSGQTYHPHYLQILSNQDVSADPYGPTANNYLALYIEAIADTASPYTVRPSFAFQDEKRVNTSSGTLPNNLRATTENRSTGYCNQSIPSGFTLGACYADTTYYSADVLTASGASITKGQWVQVDTWIKMNSIVGGIGQQDGVMQMWINGNLVMNQSNIQWKTNQNPTLAFRQVVLAPWIGDGSPINSNTMYFDELTVYGTNQRQTVTPTSAPAPVGVLIK